MDKRIEKQNEIIKKARETFLQKGLFDTAMSDIAKKAAFTRRTLYRYFESKEELAYETTIQLLNEWNTYQKAIFKKLKGTGIERLEDFLNQLINYMEDKIDVMKYLGEFDIYFTDQRVAKPSTDSIKRFNEIILESDGLLSQIIILGQKDRSIKEELDVDLTVTTMSNVLWGFGQRIAIRKEIIEEETGRDALSLMKNQVSIYIMAMKEVHYESNKIT